MNEEAPKKLDWIELVQNLSDLSEIETTVRNMLSENVNAVAEMNKAQAAVRKYVDKKEEIPHGLSEAIQVLGNSPSGYTGLTVWEAFLNEP